MTPLRRIVNAFEGPLVGGNGGIGGVDVGTVAMLFLVPGRLVVVPEFGVPVDLLLRVPIAVVAEGDECFA